MSEPKVTAFACNWCSYAGADLAGVSRMQYPPNIRIIRVMCSGRVEPHFITDALMSGADGVLVLGCHPGDCHYMGGNIEAKRRLELLQELFRKFSLDDRRVRIEWVSASEGDKLARTVKEFVETLRNASPMDADAFERLDSIGRALKASRLRIVLGSTKRAFESGGIEEERYKKEMLAISSEEVLRQNILKILESKGPLSARKIAEAVGITPKDSFRQMLAMKRRGMIEESGIESHAPVYGVPKR